MSGARLLAPLLLAHLVGVITREPKGLLLAQLGMHVQLWSVAARCTREGCARLRCTCAKVQA
eukprot:scaffold53762_cov49-Phaeocystis_antarctica.AAC.3